MFCFVFCVFVFCRRRRRRRRLLPRASRYDSYESSKPNGEVEITEGTTVHAKEPRKGRERCFKITLPKGGSNRMDALVLSADTQVRASVHRYPPVRF